MGPSGSGKSTLLTCVAGLERPTDGRVLIAGADITDWTEDQRTRFRRERIGFVFQAFHLMPYLTAEQNVGLPLRLAGRRVDRARVRGAARPGRPRRPGRPPAVRAVGRPAAAGRDRARPGRRAGRRARRRADRRPRLGHRARGARVAPGVRRRPATRRSSWSPTTRSRRRTPTRVVFLVDGRVAGRMDRPDRGRGRRPDGPPRRARGGGVMTTLALASLRHRATASTATFVSVLLGTALMGSFATLVETATGPVSSRRPRGARHHGRRGRRLGRADRALRRRLDRRHHRRRSATPRSGCCAPSAARRARRAGWSGPRRSWWPSSRPPPVPRSRALGGRGAARPAPPRRPGRRRRSTTAAAGVSPATAVVVVLVSLLAAGIAGRRATRGRGHGRPGRGACAGATGMRWWRVAAGVLLIGYGVGMGVVTVTVTAHDDDPYAAMQTSGSCSILVGLGLAALAPWLLRRLSTLARPALGRSGAAGHLAAYNTSRQGAPAGRRARAGHRAHRRRRRHADAGRHRRTHAAGDAGLRPRTPPTRSTCSTTWWSG